MSCFGCWPPQAATAHSSARLPALRLAGLRAGTLRQSPAGNGRFFRGRRAQPGRRQGPCPRGSWLGGCLPGAFLTAMTRGMPRHGRRGGHRPEPVRVQRRSDSRRRRPRPRALDADLQVHAPAAGRCRGDSALDTGAAQSARELAGGAGRCEDDPCDRRDSSDRIGTPG